MILFLCCGGINCQWICQAATTTTPAVSGADVMKYLQNYTADASKLAQREAKLREHAEHKFWNTQVSVDYYYHMHC